MTGFDSLRSLNQREDRRSLNQREDRRSLNQREDRRSLNQREDRRSLNQPEDLDALAHRGVEVVELLRTLIRFESTNWGGGRARGERAAAEFCAQTAKAAGFETTLLARSDAPERANLVVRVPGQNPDLGGILIQGHLDVVPAESEQWSTDPFAGEVSQGYVIGRGADDMLDACAMSLATIAQWGREGVRPQRDVLFAFVADEEDTGAYGAEWLVAEHPGLFQGIEAAFGESGGRHTPTPDVTGRLVHLYPVACAERGTMHLRITATGASGHGSRPSGQDAIARLLRVLHRLGEHRWPMHLCPTVAAELTELASALGLPRPDLDDEESVQRVISALGDRAGPLPWTIRASTTPTMLTAGYKVNVIPGEASAEVDVRCPPGFEEKLAATLCELVTGEGVRWDYSTRQSPVEAPLTGPWLAAMRRVLTEFDPQAVLIPGCLGGGTDAKAFAKLGIPSYGFTPLGPDPDGRLAGGQHGIDERVPVASLIGGQQIFRRFLEEV